MGSGGVGHPVTRRVARTGRLAPLGPVAPAAAADGVAAGQVARAHQVGDTGRRLRRARRAAERQRERQRDEDRAPDDPAMAPRDRHRWRRPSPPLRIGGELIKEGAEQVAASVLVADAVALDVLRGGDPHRARVGAADRRQVTMQARTLHAIDGSKARAGWRVRAPQRPHVRARGGSAPTRCARGGSRADRRRPPHLRGATRAAGRAIAVPSRSKAHRSGALPRQLDVEALRDTRADGARYARRSMPWRFSSSRTCLGVMPACSATCLTLPRCRLSWPIR